MHRWVIRRLPTARSWRSRICVALLTSLAVVGVMASPVSSQAAVPDPDLATIMKLSPAGFERAERDRFPEGPVAAATLTTLGVTALPVGANDAAFYGASYERSDGAVIGFLGMSSSHQADGQAFADEVLKVTLKDGTAFSTGIPRAAGAEAQSNGVHAVAIVFARNGRGFAVISFGANARDDGSAFAKFVVGIAESTPTRPDAKPVERLRPAEVAIAAIGALAVFGIVALWQYARRRKKGSRSGEPTARPRPHGAPRTPANTTG